MKKSLVLISLLIVGGPAPGSSAADNVAREAPEIGRREIRYVRQETDETARYELYALPQIPPGEKTSAAAGERTYVFMVDKKTGRVWRYDNRFVAFLKVGYIDINAASSDEAVRKKLEERGVSYTP